MPHGEHKNKLLGWHPKKHPEHAAWIREEAKRRGVSLGSLLDDALAAYYMSQTSAQPAPETSATPIVETGRQPAKDMGRRRMAEQYLAAHPDDSRTVDELLRAG